jgi:hypothetical protein
MLKMAPQHAIQKYQKGMSTLTDFCLEFSSSITKENIEDAIDALPPELREEIVRFVEQYDPNTRYFRVILLPNSESILLLRSRLFM